MGGTPRVLRELHPVRTVIVQECVHSVRILLLRLLSLMIQLLILWRETKIEDRDDCWRSYSLISSCLTVDVRRGSVVGESEFKSEDSGFDSLVRQDEGQFFYPS